MKKILIIEDDKALNNGITLALMEESVQIDNCFCIKDAIESLKVCKYDLVVLDINLPDGSGLDFLTKFRKDNDTAVIILTANDMETDIVTGLSMGADDYITKPFSLAVLRARVAVQLRKKRSNREAVFREADYVFDFEKMEFSFKGYSVELSKTEQKLLRLLVENRGRVMQRDTLIDRVWSDGAEFVDANALSVAVKRLRDKLTASEKIKTIYGIGYSWAES